MNASSLFKSIFQKSCLMEIYKSSVKYNSAVGIDRINTKVFEKHLDNNLDIISRKVLNGTYKFSSYQEKLLSRGAKKLPRVISIPTIRDKVTLKALFRILSSLYKDEMPFLHKIVNDVNHTIRQKQFDGVLRVDVKDFYPSISHKLLIKQLSNKIRKKEITRLISNSISQQTISKGSSKEISVNEKGLPQGLPISNVLANIYMRPIDNKYKKLSSLAYFRYVDDILIFCCESEIGRIRKRLTKDCKNIGLELHGEDDKRKNFSGKASSTFGYLGYIFSDSLVTVRAESLENLRESIIKSFTSYKYSKKPNKDKLLIWTLNLRITGCQFNETNFGWLFYFSQINDLQLLASLDHFVTKQLFNFGIDPKNAHVKKFMRSYYEMTKNLKESKYIPNFEIYDLPMKKSTLSTIFNIDVDQLRDNQVEHLFRKKIFQSIKDLEKDLLKHS